MSKLIQKGNAKLHNTYMFNVPATREVCSMTCSGCYAIKEQVRFPAALAVRQARYQASLQPDFVMRIKKEIAAIRKKPRFFRIHASGEFYSQLYLDNWCKIAAHFPDIVFYAYTKRMRHFDFTALKALDNTVVMDSFQHGALNYGPLDKAPKNAMVCPVIKGSDATCGESCTYCMTQEAQDSVPYFKKH